MGLSEDIKQKKFRSEYSKALINILYTNSWLHEHLLRLFRDYGLTEPQYNVLRILRGQYPNACTINLIISRMLDRMSNASRIVDKLEKKGLVKRSQSEFDRRAVDVIITQKGLDLLAELDEPMAIWEDNLTGLTVTEATQLNDLLDKLRTSHSDD
ncbi:MAG: MarR family transcriptional regulator [Cyclobacteriaceae bacterium]